MECTNLLVKLFLNVYFFSMYMFDLMIIVCMGIDHSIFRVLSMGGGLTRYYNDNLLGFQHVTIVSSLFSHDKRTMNLKRL